MTDRRIVVSSSGFGYLMFRGEFTLFIACFCSLFAPLLAPSFVLFLPFIRSTSCRVIPSIRSNNRPTFFHSAYRLYSPCPSTSLPLVLFYPRPSDRPPFMLFYPRPSDRPPSFILSFRRPTYRPSTSPRSSSTGGRDLVHGKGQIRCTE
jgi:hypothetical protein